MKDLKILLVGAGGIAPEYVKALRAVGVQNIDVLARTKTSAQKLVQDWQLGQAFSGGVDTLATIAKKYDGVALASSIESLLPLMKVLADCGAQKVMVEKPVALSSQELRAFIAAHPQFEASVALNRVYFPSVSLLREHMKNEEVTSAAFSFTEWVHRIDANAYSARELARWGASNCIHVIATAFDLIGMPKELHSVIGGKSTIAWHPAGAVFSGSGWSSKDIPFSYQSDWRSAGRWWLSVSTTRGRYDLMPMEGVTFTERGTVAPQVLMAPYAGETKCGFEPMLRAWLEPEGHVVGLKELVFHLEAIEAIFGYDPAA
jgi:hypothetical protein